MNAKDTSTETKPDLSLEIAHVLLIDVVGYSKFLVNEQIELLQDLNRPVSLFPHRGGFWSHHSKRDRRAITACDRKPPRTTSHYIR